MNIKRHLEDWLEYGSISSNIMWLLTEKLNTSSQMASDLIFTRNILNGDAVYTHATHSINSMPETVAHRILRSSKKANQPMKFQRSICSIKVEQGEDLKVPLLPEHPHTPRTPILRHCQQILLPSFLCDKIPKVHTFKRSNYCINYSNNYVTIFQNETYN
jgi:DNA helicase INO80